MEHATSDWYKEILRRISKNKKYKENELWHIMNQLIDAFSFLQTEKLSHRDIKPQNILLFKYDKIKLCDFGEAKKIINSGLDTIRGSELYMSPSLFQGLQQKLRKVKHNCYKSDVFSLGMSILLGATLNFDILYSIRKNENSLKVKELFVDSLKSNGYSNKLINTLILMLEQEEDKRPDFIQLQDYVKSIK